MRTYLLIFAPLCYAAASSLSPESAQLIQHVMEDLRLDGIGNKLIKDYLNGDAVIHDDDLVETIYRMSIVQDKVNRSGSLWSSQSSDILGRAIRDLISRITDRSMLEQLLSKYERRISSFQSYGDYSTGRPPKTVYVTDRVFYWNLRIADVKLIIQHAKTMRDLVATKLAPPKPAAQKSTTAPAAPRQRDAASLMMERALAAFEKETAEATAALGRAA